MNQRLIFFLTVFTSLLGAVCNADVLFSVSSPLPGNTAKRGDGPYTTGNAFTVAEQNLLVDKLGVMDVGNDGFYAPRPKWVCGLETEPRCWAPVTVSSTDPLNGGYRYHSLASPVTLKAGATYLIGARVGSGIEWFYDALPNTLASANPAIFLGDACFNGATGLAAPTNSSGFVARWGGGQCNFRYHQLASYQRLFNHH